MTIRSNAGYSSFLQHVNLPVLSAPTQLRLFLSRYVLGYPREAQKSSINYQPRGKEREILRDIRAVVLQGV